MRLQVLCTFSQEAPYLPRPDCPCGYLCSSAGGMCVNQCANLWISSCLFTSLITLVCRTGFDQQCAPIDCWTRALQCACSHILSMGGCFHPCNNAPPFWLQVLDEFYQRDTKREIERESVCGSYLISCCFADSHGFCHSIMSPTFTTIIMRTSRATTAC
jgi:hypothetical protein